MQRNKFKPIKAKPSVLVQAPKYRSFPDAILKEFQDMVIHKQAG
jgi:hypothetical protein